MTARLRIEGPPKGPYAPCRSRPSLCRCDGFAWRWCQDGAGPGCSLRPACAGFIWHRPLRFLDRRVRETLEGVQPGQTVTLRLRLGRLETPRSPNLPIASPACILDGGLTLVFFNAKPAWLAQQFPEGQDRLVSGKIERFRDSWQIVHPDLSCPLIDR